MKLIVKFREGKQIVTIQYSVWEMNFLGNKYKSLGLIKSETTTPFRQNLEKPVAYWRDTDDKFGKLLAEKTSLNSLRVYNSINDPLVYNGVYNIGVLRLAETEFSFSPTHLITSPDLDRLSKGLSVAIKCLYECKPGIEVDISIPVTIKEIQIER